MRPARSLATILFGSLRLIAVGGGREGAAISRTALSTGPACRGRPRFFQSRGAHGDARLRGRRRPSGAARPPHLDHFRFAKGRGRARVTDAATSASGRGTDSVCSLVALGEGSGSILGLAAGSVRAINSAGVSTISKVVDFLRDQLRRRFSHSEASAPSLRGSASSLLGVPSIGGEFQSGFAVDRRRLRWSTCVFAPRLALRRGGGPAAAGSGASGGFGRHSTR